MTTKARAAGEADDDDELVELVEEEEEVEDEPKVKRTNMVLDWDGKPIPYWLYRLHGLNHTFTCEICGDHIYRGPKVGLAAIVFITSLFSFATFPAREIAGTFVFSNCKSRLAFRPLRSTLQSGVTRTVCVVWAFPTPNTLRT